MSGPELTSAEIAEACAWAAFDRIKHVSIEEREAARARFADLDVDQLRALVRAASIALDLKTLSEVSA